MEIPIESLTPRQIVSQLNNYIVGQEEAKRAVAIALRNRYRRQKLPPEQREDIIPKNILMIGPTGVGKTEIARRLAQLARAPFIKVEATKFTEVGYVGRDVDSIIRDLVNVSMRLVENEKIEEVRPAAERRAIDRIVDLLVKPHREVETTTHAEDSFRQAFERVMGASVYTTPPPSAEGESSYGERSHAAFERQKRKLREQIESGTRDDEFVEIEIEEAHTPFMQVFTPQGMEEMGFDLSAQLANAFGKQTTHRRVSVAEAKGILTDEEARKMIDRSALTREAIQRAEQTGIVFLDEIDKIAGRESTIGPDVSREGVQRDLLPIIEGSTVITKYGPVRTDHILFICAGAFNVSKPSDLIPELQGRLPIRVELTDLGEHDLRRILTEPKNALTKQYAQLLAADDVIIEFQEEAIDEIARMAHEVNLRTENIGARRLHTVMEKLLEDVLFEAPETETKRITINAEWVHRKLSELVKDTDLSKYIL